jgi:hypothetical protein
MGEINKDVKKVMEEIEIEDEDNDEKKLEVIEEIWMKDGEMDVNEVTV